VAGTNRRSRCLSTHPVPPSPGRGLGPGRFGGGGQVRSTRAKRLPPSLSPRKGKRPTGGGHPVESGRKRMTPGEFGYSIPSSCPSPSGEETRERGSLLWVAYRLSRRWHLGSDPGRTGRAASLPRRRENKREGQPDDSLPVVDRYTARQSPACLHTNAQVVSIPSSCPSPSGEGTRGPGVCARPRNQAPGPKARPGPLAVRLFPSPFGPVKKETSRRGIPAGRLQKTRSSCMFSAEPLRNYLKTRFHRIRCRF
jgi:hypothetical protein